MPILLDTSILCRLANSADTNFPVARAAISKLHLRGEVVYITPQNLVEFRNVATRPIKDDGLGLSSMAASQLATTFEASFPLLNETPAIYPAWRALVEGLDVRSAKRSTTRGWWPCATSTVSHRSSRST